MACKGGVEPRGREVPALERRLSTRVPFLLRLTPGRRSSHFSSESVTCAWRCFRLFSDPHPSFHTHSSAGRLPSSVSAALGLRPELRLLMLLCRRGRETDRPAHTSPPALSLPELACYPSSIHLSSIIIIIIILRHIPRYLSAKSRKKINRF